MNKGPLYKLTIKGTGPDLSSTQSSGWERQLCAESSTPTRPSVGTQSPRVLQKMRFSTYFSILDTKHTFHLQNKRGLTAEGCKVLTQQDLECSDPHCASAGPMGRVPTVSHESLEGQAGQRSSTWGKQNHRTHGKELLS